MSLVLIGISHKTASIRIREKFSWTNDQLSEGLKKLYAIDSVRGVIVLSTCNRMEIYTHLTDNVLGMRELIRFLKGSFSAKEFQIKRHFYVLKDAGVVKHIFRVASGLDSQILGETQILGQVKFAWEMASRAGVTCDLSDALFADAVSAGKEVRSSTEISQGNVSVGSVAIEMLEEQFGRIQNKSILVIGTGKIGSLVCNYLKQKNVSTIFVSNRTYARACELALRCGGKVINFSQLKDELRTADIIISSTSSPHIILSYNRLSEAMKLRNKPLTIMDLALPRDVDPQAKNIPGISLFVLDDLKSVVEVNHAKRQKEAISAEKIIQKRLSMFLETLCIKKEKDLCLAER